MPPVDFTASLQNGLRPDSRMQVNAPFLVTCQNMRPSPYGLKDFHTVVQPITASELSSLSISKSWPFPQLFRGKSQTLLFDATKVYTVDESTPSDWQLTLVTTYDAANLDSGGTATKSISTGGPWHFVDFYDTWFAFNGVSTVFSIGGTVYTTDAVTISTGTDYKESRFFMGGFTTDMYDLVDWPSVLASLEGTNLPAEWSAKIASGPADTNWVWWSSIAGGDFLWLFSLNLMRYAALTDATGTGYSIAQPYFRELWRRNETGLRPMPWQGTVYKMQQLNDLVMVYGTGGVTALFPMSGEMNTFGWMTPQGWGTRLGIASRSAAGGSNGAHLVVDEAGELWGIDPQAKAQRLGYREWLSPMLSNNIVVSYEEQLGEWYISDGTTTYLYSESGGFCKAPYAPTTVSFADATPVGITIAAAEASAVDIKSEWFRGGAPGEIWTLDRLRLGTTDIDNTGWSVYVEFRYSDAKAATSTSAETPDKRGVANFNQAGIEFRWRLTHPDKTKCDLETVVADMSMGGKTSSRTWLNASTPSAGTV